MKPAACLALLAALAAADAAARAAQPSAQQAQEQRQGDPQAQEEQAGNAALQPARKPGEQPVKGQPQGRPGPLPQPDTTRHPVTQPIPTGGQKLKTPPRRRSTPAIIGTMPAPSAPLAYGPVLNPPAPSYGPVLNAPPAPAYVAPSSGAALPGQLPGAAPGGLPSPAPVVQCIGGQCSDTSGNSYHIGTGNVGTDSSGRQCVRNGNFIQCF